MVDIFARVQNRILIKGSDYDSRFGRLTDPFGKCPTSVPVPGVGGEMGWRIWSQ
jgi:hypothetical protein